MNSDHIISVIGLGYVGLPLVVAFGKYKDVIAFDINFKRVHELKNGIDSVSLFDETDINQSTIQYTDDPERLKQANFHIIAVPTPINDAKQPDLGPLFSATELLGKQLKQGDIVVYESTVYPGLTEEECIPLLESTSGLGCGKDFHVGYSPERINPGDKQHKLENTIKVISAQNEITLKHMKAVYGSILGENLYEAPSIKVAEAAKVIENTQRDINIALMNELSLIFNKMDIDTVDVLETAATKWNFLKFSPGLVGGHCIGVDPYYLTYKASHMNYAPRVILSGRSVNDSMGFYVARMLVKHLIKSGITIKGATVTMLGFAFKENIPDIRNTRVIDMVNELESFDVATQIYDPMVNNDDVKAIYDKEMSEKKDLKPAHAVILAVTHSEFVEGSWGLIKSLLIGGKGIVFDVKSVLPRENKPDDIALFRL